MSAVLTIVESILEFTTQHKHFSDEEPERGYSKALSVEIYAYSDIFAHGGMTFTIITRILYTGLYALPLLVPHTPLRSLFSIPGSLAFDIVFITAVNEERRRFYIYCALMCALNAFAVLAAALILGNVLDGLW